MAGPVEITERFSGGGPEAELGAGVSAALDRAAWTEMESRLPDGHPARGKAGPVDFTRSALLFVRLGADSNTELHVESAERSGQRLTLRLTRRQSVPDLLAVVPAQAWLLLEVPQKALQGRPALSVLVNGAPWSAQMEYL
ncbi:MAG TPA: hypothetical protein VKB92_10115 [Myxococcales bacterium]|nr:hypothetical protein [Myxococcales bacterium]